MAKLTKMLRKARKEEIVIPKRIIFIAYAFDVPHEGKEYLLYCISYVNGKIHVKYVKTSKVLEVLCLPGDCYVVRTNFHDYIVFMAHSFYKRPSYGLVYLAVAFVNPVPGYPFDFRKIDCSHDGETVGLIFSHTSPVETVEYLSENICVVTTPNNKYIVLINKNENCH